MSRLFQLLSALGLAATIVPCLLAFFGLIGLPAVKASALTGTLVWFATAPLWLGKELPLDAGEVEI